MFIDTLKWHVAKLAACSAALVCTMAIGSNASVPTSLPKPGAAGSAVALYSIDQTSRLAQRTSFAERFAVVQAPLFDHVLTSLAYHGPIDRAVRQFVAGGDAVEGAASTYDPTNAKDRDAGSMQTSSGDIYDPDGWTAAIQIDLRWQFGGVRYGRNYVPTYALVECNGMRAIVKINDVGPLRPGRVIDLNTRAMRYFDPSMQIGVLKDVTVTPLAGTDIAVGPVETWPTMAGDFATVW